MKKLNNKGFSLVELMVVVAIIGILSAIAIPNFQRFQRKSRQSEAKSTLGAIYAAQKAFHQEWNRYYNDLDVTGYVPSGQLRYNAGFSAAGAALPAAIPGYQGPANSGFFTTTLVCAAAAYSGSCTQIESVALALAPAPANPAGTGNGATFTAVATTNSTTINAGAATDQWTMTQAGVLLNAQSGI